MFKVPTEVLRSDHSAVVRSSKTRTGPGGYGGELGQHGAAQQEPAAQPPGPHAPGTSPFLLPGTEVSHSQAFGNSAHSVSNGARRRNLLVGQHPLPAVGVPAGSPCARTHRHAVHPPHLGERSPQEPHPTATAAGYATGLLLPRKNWFLLSQTPMPEARV